MSTTITCSPHVASPGLSLIQALICYGHDLLQNVPYFLFSDLRVAAYSGFRGVHPVPRGHAHVRGLRVSWGILDAPSIHLALEVVRIVCPLASKFLSSSNIHRCTHDTIFVWRSAGPRPSFQRRSSSPNSPPNPGLKPVDFLSGLALRQSANWQQKQITFVDIKRADKCPS